MMEPLVSVIVLTYNQETMIAQTLDSILAQKGVDFEIIIGEDSSPDGTRAICEEYVASYPDIIRMMPAAPNKGLMRNYADCLREVRGKYIAGCAGDDYWNGVDSLARRVIFLEENPDFGMVHTNFDVLNMATGKVERSAKKEWFAHFRGGQWPTYEDMMCDELHIPCALTLVWRRELIEKYINIDDYACKGFLMEDLPMHLELSQHTKFQFLDFCSGTYRVMQGSICNNKNDLEKGERFVKNVAEVKSYFLDKYPIEGLSEEDIWQKFYALITPMAMALNHKTKEREYFSLWKPKDMKGRLRKFCVVCPGLRQLYKKRLLN